MEAGLFVTFVYPMGKVASPQMKRLSAGRRNYDSVASCR